MKRDVAGQEVGGAIRTPMSDEVFAVYQAFRSHNMLPPDFWPVGETDEERIHSIRSKATQYAPVPEPEATSETMASFLRALEEERDPALRRRREASLPPSSASPQGEP